ncbi:hypothetical protein [Burkholderia cenocepacia]|uniref:hypothetical protein n=1 Tax=Burkholderia cenocepacia TaxID=95486 RepID=UPI002B242258|nr:hypothetical protein [Burkholderia cenocepacia]MEB2500730.1 hypothetical protein [Burkholderia cenocepacia]MEB2558258.1 hypothetical protein [Burkholderia cenocepacia]
MNVVVDYPEEFPLVGVDRKVFDHQVRHVFAQLDAYSARALARLAERIGFESRFHSPEYDELEALLTLVRTEPDQAVLDQLLLRAGEFLHVRLRLPEFVDSSNNRGPQPAQVPRSWIVAGATALVATLVAAFVWGAPAAASVVDWIVGRPNVSPRAVPLAATSTPASSAPAFDLSRQTSLPASTGSALPVDETTALTLTTWTHDPLAAMDGVKRLMPKADGIEYQIDVTVSRPLPALRTPETRGDQK